MPYTALPDMNYTPDLDGQGGVAFNGICNNRECCEARCNARADCGVYVFGTLVWNGGQCIDCCWLKRVPTAADTTSHLPGITTYVKLPTGEEV
jgi:hypothetical protein